MNEKMLEVIKEDIYSYIHTSIPAKIIKFDHVEMTATIQILGKLKIRGQEQVPKEIFRVPVGHLRTENFAQRIPLSENDLVLVSFSEVSLEKILKTGMPESVLSGSRFDLTDAIISVPLALEGNKLPSENEKDFCTWNLKTGHSYIFKENGDLDFDVGNLNIKAENINIKTGIIEIDSPIINAVKSILTIKNIAVDMFSAIKSAMLVGIDFVKHKHGGVQGGQASTGTPEE